ncbi:MAG: hypothetical protein QOC40_10845 [Nitrososphaeraceae archaeon]|nr:hypothetical protein [Nitrososphaeraceae archaeon]
MSTNKKFVSIIDDEIDITVLFEDAICSDITGISVVSFMLVLMILRLL